MITSSGTIEHRGERFRWEVLAAGNGGCLVVTGIRGETKGCDLGGTPAPIWDVLVKTFANEILHDRARILSKQVG